jgi:hypothetical protein
MIKRDNNFNLVKAIISFILVALAIVALLSCAGSKKKPTDTLSDTTKTNFISEINPKDIQRDGDDIIIQTPELYFKLVKAGNTYFATTTKETITKTVNKTTVVPAINITKNKDQRKINSNNVDKSKDKSKTNSGNVSKDKSKVNSGNKTKAKGISLWWLLLIIPALFLYSQRKKIIPAIRKTLVGI